MNTFKNDRSQGLDQGLILAYPFKKRTLPMVWRYNKAQVTSESLLTGSWWDKDLLKGQGQRNGDEDPAQE